MALISSPQLVKNITSSIPASRQKRTRASTFSASWNPGWMVRRTGTGRACGEHSNQHHGGRGRSPTRAGGWCPRLCVVRPAPVWSLLPPAASQASSWVVAHSRTILTPPCGRCARTGRPAPASGGGMRLRFRGARQGDLGVEDRQAGHLHAVQAHRIILHRRLRLVEDGAPRRASPPSGSAGGGCRWSRADSGRAGFRGGSG